MSTYTDLNANYRMDIVNTNCLSYDVENIRNSLQRLLSTGKGEVPFNREYGTSLKSLLFENNLVPSDIAAYLYMDITNWEPRVTLNPADIDIVKIDRNTYKIVCTFTIVGINGNPQTITQIISNG